MISGSRGTQFARFDETKSVIGVPQMCSSVKGDSGSYVADMMRKRNSAFVDDQRIKRL
jgi:hypothetical protein